MKAPVPFLAVLVLFCGLLAGCDRGVDPAQKKFQETQAKADQGDAAAQCELGFMYTTATGVIRDPVQAHAWWNLAAANGDPEARRNLAALEKEMTPPQMNDAVKLALALAGQHKKKP
jgi:TPR repeat protein